MKKIFLILAVSLCAAACVKHHVCPTYNDAGSNSLQHHHNGEHKPMH